MVDYTPLDTDVQNLREDAGIVETQLFEADETITLILGEHVNDNPVTVEAQHFAAIHVDRELGEEEQAVHGQEQLVFSSVLVANEDGEASQETIVNVREGGISDAIDALEQFTEDGTINVIESSAAELVVEDGEVTEIEQEPIVEE